MIIRLIKGLVVGVIKKIITLAVIIGLAVWFLFFKDASLTDTLGSIGQTMAGWFDNSISIELSHNDRQDFEVSVAAKLRIDRWIEANGYNEYGDPQGTIYAGGTPLFNEATGVTIDRYDYILSQHPELVRLLD